MILRAHPPMASLVCKLPRTSGVAPQKWVVEGDPASAGSIFSALPSTFSLNDNGDVGFMANLSGASSGGVFVGRASGAPEAVVRTSTRAVAETDSFKETLVVEDRALSLSWSELLHAGPASR
jgi:hypothetical protein